MLSSNHTASRVHVFFVFVFCFFCQSFFFFFLRDGIPPPPFSLLRQPRATSEVIAKTSGEREEGAFTYVLYICLPCLVLDRHDKVHIYVSIARCIILRDFRPHLYIIPGIMQDEKHRLRWQIGRVAFPSSVHPSHFPLFRTETGPLDTCVRI